jgi:hypothetical protein
VHTPSSEYHHGDASPAVSLTDSSILLLLQETQDGVREASKESQSHWLALDARAAQGFNDSLLTQAHDSGENRKPTRRRLSRRLAELPANGFCRDNVNFRLHIIYEARGGTCALTRVEMEVAGSGETAA